MSYIGNQPTSVAFVTDQFSGNGSTVAFTTSVAPANTASVLVSVSGVLQDPTTYSVSGLTLTFSAAPPSGTGNISCRYLGIPASGVTTTAYRTQTEFTATAGQTTFSVPSYTVGYIDVYRNGALLGSADFTATNGTTVVLTNAASSGDLVETISFFVSSVLNAIPAQSNAVIDSYILSMAGSKLTGTQVIPKATLPTGSVLQVASAYKTDTQTISASVPTFVDVTGLSVTLTPTSASSKFLCIWTVTGGDGADQSHGYFRLVRNGTDIALADTGGSRTSASSCVINTSTAGQTLASSNSFLDSPATSSAVTYKITASRNGAGTNCFINRSSRDIDSADNDGRSTSSLTVLEIAA
jgi:hypothetical protein